RYRYPTRSPFTVYSPPILPARREIHPEDAGAAVVAREREGVVELEDECAEDIDARGGAGAEERRLLGELRPERLLLERPRGEVERLEAGVVAPRDAGVGEERELGREVGEVDEAEVARAEEGEADLRARHADAATVEAVEHLAAHAVLEGARPVAAHERAVAEEEREEPVVLRVRPVAAEVERARGERDGADEEVAAVVGRGGGVVERAGRPVHAEAVAPAANRRGEPEVRVVPDEGDAALGEVERGDVRLEAAPPDAEAAVVVLRDVVVLEPVGDAAVAEAALEAARLGEGVGGEGGGLREEIGRAH